MANHQNRTVFHAWLASAAMPPHLLGKLFDLYPDPYDIFAAFTAGEKQIRTLLRPGFLRILEQNSTKEKLDGYASLILRHHIDSFQFSDSIYPSSLADLEDHPVILFFQGDTACLGNRKIAMVGSRAASYAGQKATRKLAKDLSSRGISVISGMACGIDAEAHRGCLEGGSPTIAVTGCGLDIVYPTGHVSLRDEILKNGGLLLSEYAPGERPNGWHFPFRNRIITGLSDALVLMEAKIRSGSMTSVQHALEQGKDVFVYPGDPSSEQFEGNHQLLREGGIYFTCAEDIIDDMRWLDNPVNVRQNSECSMDQSMPVSQEEMSVLTALIPGSLSFEQLLSATGLSPSGLMSALTLLQISGRIEAQPGKIYQIRQ